MDDGDDGDGAAGTTSGRLERALLGLVWIGVSEVWIARVCVAYVCERRRRKKSWTRREMEERSVLGGAT